MKKIFLLILFIPGVLSAAQQNLINTGTFWGPNADAAQSNFTELYGWGNHALVGYLTTESDPVFVAWGYDYNTLVNTPTGADIKISYEAEANTNAFTDAEQAKLAGIATGATANQTDAYLVSRANHTGTQTASTISDFGTAVNAITVSRSDPIAVEWAEDGATPPAPAAPISGATHEIGRAFDGATADETVTYVWKVPVGFTGTSVTVSVDNTISAATAPANTEVIAYSIAMACYGNSESVNLAAGTPQTTSFTADGTYLQFDSLTTDNSPAITPAGSIAAGERCKISVTRLATTTDTYDQDIDQTFINVNYSQVLQ